MLRNVKHHVKHRNLPICAHINSFDSIPKAGQQHFVLQSGIQRENHEIMKSGYHSDER